MFLTNLNGLLQEPVAVKLANLDNHLITFKRLIRLCRAKELKQFLIANSFILVKDIDLNIYPEFSKLLDYCLGQPTEVLNAYRNKITNYSDLVYDPNDFKPFSDNSNSYQPFHKNTRLLEQPINYVSMYCLKTSIIGGNNYFLKSEDIIRNLGIGYFASKVFYTSKITRQFDLIVGDNQLNFNPIFNKIEFEDRSSRDFFELIAYFIHFQSEPIKVSLAKNDLLIFDNNKVLHARDSFEVDSKRHIIRKHYI